MNILPYHLSETNDLLTSRAGLVTLCELMSRLEWTNQVDRLFPSPQSNRKKSKNEPPIIRNFRTHQP